jgi:hypothetical protein
MNRIVESLLHPKYTGHLVGRGCLTCFRDFGHRGIRRGGSGESLAGPKSVRPAKCPHWVVFEDKSHT